MITTLTLNPCIDRTVMLDGFGYGETNHVKSSRCDIGGKGINVGRALHHLGEEICCLGFNYRDSGSLLKDALNSERIPHDFLPVPGHFRTNIKIFDEKTSVMSELNESGCAVGGEAVTQLIEKVEACLPKTSLLVLSGSVPPGVPKDIYRILAQKAAQYGVRTIVDACGELLKKGIQGHPYLIKPNREELEETFGKTIRSKEDAIRVARGIIADGVTLVCVSMGKDGALLVDREWAFFSPGAEIPVKGVQGAGDSLVAGMSTAIERGMSGAEMLRYGVAAAYGSLILEGTQMCTKESFQRMLPLVEVKEIS